MTRRSWCGRFSRISGAGLILSAFAVTAKDKAITWENAVVVAQNLSSAQLGTYRGPIGGGNISLPIYRQTNDIVIDSPPYRYELVEATRRNFIILVVGGTVGFYRNGNWFVFVDVKNRKHKFSAISITAITSKR